MKAEEMASRAVPAEPPILPVAVLNKRQPGDPDQGAAPSHSAPSPVHERIAACPLALDALIRGSVDTCAIYPSQRHRKQSTSHVHVARALVFSGTRKRPGCVFKERSLLSAPGLV